MGNWRRHVCGLLGGRGIWAAEGVFIVLEEFLGSGEFRFRKPRVLLGGVTFPSDKVLPSGRGSFMTNDLFNFVMFLVIDEIWGWRWEVPAVDFIFVIRR